MADTRIIIVDDHPLFRDALRQALLAGFPAITIDEAGSIEELAGRLDQGTDVDLVLLDLSMPGVRGFSGLVYLRAQYPALPVVIVSATEDDRTIGRCIGLGASGYIVKSMGVEQIRRAVGDILRGQVWTPPEHHPESADIASDRLLTRLRSLTPQQVRVLMMLGQGLLNKQIAFELGISEATIKAHVSAILQKLGVDSRTQAVIAVNRIETGDWHHLND